MSALFTYSREIPAAHANPWACLRLPLPPPDDDDDDVNADADAYVHAYVDADADADDDDGCDAWDERRQPHSGHALRQLQQRILHPMPLYDGRAQRPRGRQRNRCYDVPCSCYRLSIDAYYVQLVYT